MENLRNNFKRLLFAFVIFLSGFIFVPQAKANEISTQCSNRYLTLINPVRDRSLWFDKSLGPIKQQYNDVKKYSFPATWLLQYDTFSDSDLIKEISSFDSNQEKGIFLEVSRKLAWDAGVSYPIYVRWSDPGAVFLSAYSQSERRRIIDQVFGKYKKTFGTYPKSVGAWWVDSYSLNYLVTKYGIKTVLIVADQKITDSYGVWGQWWGFPYKPSKANILVPGTDSKNAQNAVVVQWAQRDPIRAYGEGSGYSNFSLQSNDYIRNGENTDYFKELVSQYLDCKNSLGQITVGLETGMESLIEPLEYQRQLKYLSSVQGLNVVTMSSFAEKYSQLYKVNPEKVFFGSDNQTWEMTPGYRKNEGLGDNINYNQQLSFKDYFLRDNSSFLNRVLPISGSTRSMVPWYLFISFILLLVSFRFNLFKVWFFSTLVLFVSYGLLFRSTYKFGWEVFYGPQIQRLELAQIFTVVAVFGVIALINKFFKNKFNLWLLPLAFGLDRIISILRYTSIEGTKYFGIVWGDRGLLGIKIFGHSLSFTNQSFESIQFHSLTRFDFEKIWQNQILYFIIYPAVHFVLAFILWKLLNKLPKKVRLIFLIILFILFIWQLQTLFTADPLSVLGL